MPFLLKLAWRDLRSSGRSLWIFVACLALGVSLIAATSGLYKLINQSLLADTRTLLGGDLEVDSNSPLPPAVLAWMRQRGEISLVSELDSMLGTAERGYSRVELQSTDSRYPLYGELHLQPAGTLQQFTAFADNHWGLAVDPTLAAKLKLEVGDLVSVGSQQMQVRALVINQPDRNLNANWRGTPVLLSAEALQASGLLQEGSRVDYEYHVKTSIPVATWQDQFYAAFPENVWEVRTFKDRSERIAERLGQIASGLIIIAFSTLFIGGLGIYNSIHAYLQGKMKTIATLRAIGLRHRRLAMVYFLQVAMISILASLTGVIFGSALAVAGTHVIATDLPVTTTVAGLLQPALASMVFGILTAFTFALPAVGKSLAVQPAALFRASPGRLTPASRQWWLATMLCVSGIGLMLMVMSPEPAFGAGFIIVVGLILLLLNGVVLVISWLSKQCNEHILAENQFTLRLAMANLHRPGAPLKTSLLSLGSALTLLVACTLVVVSLLRTVNNTIPEEAPALVLYDILSYQVGDVKRFVEQAQSQSRIDIAPIVRGRLSRVNDVKLSDIAGLDQAARREAMEDEYKLSYSTTNIDNVSIVKGQWWNTSSSSGSAMGPAKMAMEDREANELGVQPGDILSFNIAGEELKAEVVAIYSQKGLQTRFWFEGMLSQGALEPFIHRYVGAAYTNDEDAIQLQNRIAATAPNVISVRTASVLQAASELLAKASIGLIVIAGVSLLASVLVLVSIMAAGRTRQVYETTILHSLGVRLAVIRRSLYVEYLLLALVTSIFAVLLGSAIALPLMEFRMKLPAYNLIWLAALVAVLVSTLVLSLGARYFLNKLSLTPATLLRTPS